MTDRPTGPAAAMPAAEVEIDPALVRRLLAEQQPDLADLPLTELANGWDNVLYRLGDDLVVRLPRRRLAAELVLNEQRWLPVLAPRLPLAVPVPVRVGRPSGEYPWSWSIQPWIPGRAAAVSPDLDGPAAARDLGRFLAALHRPAPADAPANPYRGGPLAERREATDERLARFADRLDVDDLRRRWERALAAPPWSGPPMWIHGDLHAHNLLADRGRLVAVIDFGDITAGDPATDLAVAWSLLEPADHEAFRRAADRREPGADARPIDDAMWHRAEGWALSVGLAILAHSADGPAMEAMARRMLRPTAAAA
jgi:aminoglycoside phosphotransferase (APT) family kinase protein